jgi:SpoVK/Ycf46/Vps4 family AAA+-type ATPase
MFTLKRTYALLTACLLAAELHGSEVKYAYAAVNDDPTSSNLQWRKYTQLSAFWLPFIQMLHKAPRLTLSDRLTKAVAICVEDLKRSTTPKNVILSGPRGTGKSVLAEQIKYKFASNVYIDAVDLFKGDSAQTQNMLSERFESLKKKEQPSLVILDNAELIFGNSALDAAYYQKRVLLLVDFMKALDAPDRKFHFLAITIDAQDLLEPLIQGATLLRTTLPTLNERKDILKHSIYLFFFSGGNFTNDVTLTENAFSEDTIDKIAAHTEGWTGMQLDHSICNIGLKAKKSDSQTVTPELVDASYEAFKQKKPIELRLVKKLTLSEALKDLIYF